MSVAMGKLLSGEAFLADYPRAAVYTDDVSFKTDSNFGLQLSAEVNQKSTFIIQALSHGAKDYEIEIDWAYLNYQLTNEISIQAGRKRIPLYYYTDHFDIAYTYYWIRPPSDNYTWQITNYNGLSVIYESVWGHWDSMINVYVGNEESENNDLLSLLSDKEVDETWKNMVGIVGELSNNGIELRLSYMENLLDRKENGEFFENEVKQQFIGTAVNLYTGNWIILTELNQYQRKSSDIRLITGLLSLAYQYKNITTHITHSWFEQKKNEAGGDENHYTNSVGARWDFEDNMALKIQLDKVIDEGVVNGIMGNGELIAISLDLVF